MTVGIAAVSSEETSNPNKPEYLATSILQETAPEVLQTVIDQSKIAGNKAFKDRQYNGTCRMLKLLYIISRRKKL